MRALKRSAVSLLISLTAIFVMTSASHGADPIPVIRATQPWMSAMARFLVGGTAVVRPVLNWDASGAAKRARNIRRDDETIALDAQDAREAGVTESSLHTLYDRFPIPADERARVPFDPSALPFISTRLLIVLSELMPDNYPFYQRRLAEFQSRLESTLEVGRSLIKGVKVLDLTGSVGPWIQAASIAERPDRELMAAWRESTRTPELRDLLASARASGMWIVTDVWTPAVIRKIVSEGDRAIEIKPPASPDYDLFAYLHDIYLEIWNSVNKN